MYVKTTDNGVGQTLISGNGWGQYPSLGLGSYVGEIRRGPDGRDYQWTTHVDGLGNVGGFWKDITDRAKKGWQQLKETMRKTMARGILNHPNITLATAHVTTPLDNATARLNIDDTSQGREASLSNVGTAPGGTVKLDLQLLASILRLADTFSFSISELAGGQHAAGSRHYKGVTVDVNVINGQHVGASHPDVATFRQQCRDLGATEVKGPGDPGHSTHVHCAWPKP